MARTGRPPTSKPTPEQKQQIIDAMSEGDSLRRVCETLRLQRVAVWREYDADPEFRASIARARELAGEAHADRAAEIVDKIERGELAPDAGRVVLAGLQWQAAKQAPKRFSDRHVIAGEKESPLFQSTDEQIEARIAELLSRKAP